MTKRKQGRAPTKKPPVVEGADELYVEAVALANMGGGNYGAVMMSIPLSEVMKYAVAKRTPDIKGIAIDHCIGFLTEGA